MIYLFSCRLQSYTNDQWSSLYNQIILYTLKVNVHQQLSRRISMSSISNERFGTSEGGSGWSWDKGGIGMGGKEAGI